MKPLPLAALASLVLLGGHAVAQEQERGIQRIFSAAATDRVDGMQNKSFGGATDFAAKTYAADTYSGVQSAEIKEFTTKSFFGIKNPWFGKAVYEAPTDQLSQKTDRAAADAFDVNDYATAEYDTRKGESEYTETPVPTALRPREFAVFDPRSRESASTREMQGFVNNLDQDLSIDDVRALLNKGQETQP